MIDWRMYAKIQELRNKKFKKTQVAKKLGINRETVAKYWTMKPLMNYLLENRGR